jgi:hypothetical protein
VPGFVEVFHGVVDSLIGVREELLLTHLLEKAAVTHPRQHLSLEVCQQQN